MRVWDSSTGQQLQILKGHTNAVWSAAFSSDDRRIVSGSEDKTVRVWMASTGEYFETLGDHAKSIHFVSFSNNAGRLVSQSENDPAHVWTTSAGELLMSFDGQNSGLTSIQGPEMISGPNDDALRLRDTTRGRRTRGGYLAECVEGADGAYTGWLLTSHGEGYLAYVPLDAELLTESNILTIPTSAASYIDLTNASIGPEWHKCYQPLV